MKKQVSEFVKTLGGSTAYSGNRRTMFINGSQKIESMVIYKFGYGLPFKLSTNK